MATTRTNVCKKYILNDSGQVVSGDSPEEMGHIACFEYVNGYKLMVDVREYDEYIKTRSLIHSTHQKIGDEYAGVKDDTDEAIERSVAMKERLLSGAWISDAKGGGTSHAVIHEAVVRVLEAQGANYDAEKTKAKYLGRGTQAACDKAMESEKVRAAIAAIKAERAIARAKALADKAEGTEGEDLAALA
jgi:hypothetical protein